MTTKWDPSIFKEDLRQFVSEPSEKEKAAGLIARMPGKLPCPICGCVAVEDPSNLWIATCKMNPSHQIKWEPWGG